MNLRPLACTQTLGHGDDERVDRTQGQIGVLANQLGGSRIVPGRQGDHVELLTTQRHQESASATAPSRNVTAGQSELFPTWRYHAFITDSAVELVQAEKHHREHAIIEKQGAEYGCTRVRGLHPLPATVSTPIAAPVLVSG